MARKSAYLRQLEARQLAYRETFEADPGREVFRDLYEQFFMESPVGASTDETLINIGKAEVIRYIMNNLHLTLKDVEVLHAGPGPEWEPNS